jgi:hypothetical protein
MPKAGEGFSFFGFGSTNMPRRRRWGRTPCQNHFAMDVWGNFPPVGSNFSMPPNSTTNLTTNSREELGDKRTLKGQTIHLQKAFKPRFHFQHNLELSCRAFNT